MQTIIYQFYKQELVLFHSQSEIQDGRPFIACSGSLCRDGPSDTGADHKPNLYIYRNMERFVR